MLTELDVLGIVGDRLTACEIPFMLTGSFAMAHYTTPRMTRDLDIVVAMRVEDVQCSLGRSLVSPSCSVATCDSC